MIVALNAKHVVMEKGSKCIYRLKKNVKRGILKKQKYNEKGKVEERKSKRMIKRHRRNKRFRKMRAQSKTEKGKENMEQKNASQMDV